MENEKLEILVVEDENTEIAKKYFDSMSNICVDYAETKAEALSKLTEREYDGLITDKNFPTNKGEPAHYNSEEIKYRCMIKGMPWVEYSSHGPSPIFCFPIRKIDADESKEAGSFSEWKISHYEDFEPQHEVAAFNDLKDPKKIIYEGDPKSPQKIIGVIESKLSKYQKTNETGWEEAFSILRNVIDMYKKESDLVDYFIKKAKDINER